MCVRTRETAADRPADLRVPKGTWYTGYNRTNIVVACTKMLPSPSAKAPMVAVAAALVVAVHSFPAHHVLGFTFGGVTSTSAVPVTDVLTRLHAKGAGKKNKKVKKKAGGAASAGGGFGKKPAAAEVIDVDDDYSAFPALEAGVKETLIPAPAELSTVAGDLDGEMYDRLAQIYGFDWFNYAEGEDPCEDDEAKDTATSASSSPMSFDELLSGGESSSSASSSSSDFGDLLGSSKSSSSTSASDFADLIAEATGGGSSSSTATKPKVDPTAPVGPLDLAKLPPFEKFRVLSIDPLVLVVDDFFTAEECDKYIQLAMKPNPELAPTVEIQSKTVGKNARDRAQRTSTTWFNHYKSTPELVGKASRLLGLTGIDRWEEPQIVRYRKGEKFTWHLDALAPDGELASLGGQRIATLLVYLSDLSEEQGGATMFRDLGGDEGPLKVAPKKGSALLFFPAAGGIPNVPFDIRTLHCGEAVAKESSADKWISQLWLRETAYKPTAPPDNSHAAAAAAINEYCSSK